MNLYEKLFDEKAVDEFVSKVIQEQEEEIVRKTKKALEYYKDYPFLYRSFFYESKLIPDFPSNWFLISSFDELVVLASMFGDVYHATVPPLAREYEGKGFYGVDCDPEFAELRFYKLDNYISEAFQMRKKMDEVYAKLPN